MANRYVWKISASSLLKAFKNAVGIGYDTSDDKLKFLDDDGSTVRSVVTEDQSQTLTNKTLTAPTIAGATVTRTAAALAATGADQAGAAPIVSASGAFIHATAADGTKGIRLPAAVAGMEYLIKNSDAANAVLKVYPATGDAINALAANASLDMAAKTSVLLVALDGTTWYSLPLLPS